MKTLKTKPYKYNYSGTKRNKIEDLELFVLTITDEDKTAYYCPPYLKVLNIEVIK